MANTDIVQKFQEADKNKDGLVSQELVDLLADTDKGIDATAIADVLNTKKQELLTINGMETAVRGAVDVVLAKEKNSLSDTDREVLMLHASLYLGYVGGVGVEKKEEGPKAVVVVPNMPKPQPKLDPTKLDFADMKVNADIYTSNEKQKEKIYDLCKVSQMAGEHPTVFDNVPKQNADGYILNITSAKGIKGPDGKGIRTTVDVKKNKENGKLTMEPTDITISLGDNKFQNMTVSIINDKIVTEIANIAPTVSCTQIKDCSPMAPCVPSDLYVSYDLTGTKVAKLSEPAYFVSTYPMDRNKKGEVIKTGSVYFNNKGIVIDKQGVFAVNKKTKTVVGYRVESNATNQIGKISIADKESQENKKLKDFKIKEKVYVQSTIKEYPTANGEYVLYPDIDGQNYIFSTLPNKNTQGGEHIRISISDIPVLKDKKDTPLYVTINNKIFTLSAKMDGDNKVPTMPEEVTQAMQESLYTTKTNTMLDTVPKNGRACREYLQNEHGIQIIASKPTPTTTEDIYSKSLDDLVQADVVMNKGEIQGGSIDMKSLTKDGRIYRLGDSYVMLSRLEDSMTQKPYLEGKKLENSKGPAFSQYMTSRSAEFAASKLSTLGAFVPGEMTTGGKKSFTVGGKPYALDEKGTIYVGTVDDTDKNKTLYTDVAKSIIGIDKKPYILKYDAWKNELVIDGVDKAEAGKIESTTTIEGIKTKTDLKNGLVYATFGTTGSKQVIQDTAGGQGQLWKDGVPNINTYIEMKKSSDQTLTSYSYMTKVGEKYDVCNISTAQKDSITKLQGNTKAFGDVKIDDAGLVTLTQKITISEVEKKASAVEANKTLKATTDAKQKVLDALPKADTGDDGVNTTRQSAIDVATKDVKSTKDVYDKAIATEMSKESTKEIKITIDKAGNMTGLANQQSFQIGSLSYIYDASKGTLTVDAASQKVQETTDATKTAANTKVQQAQGKLNEAEQVQETAKDLNQQINADILKLNATTEKGPFDQSSFTKLDMTHPDLTFDKCTKDAAGKVTLATIKAKAKDIQTKNTGEVAKADAAVTTETEKVKVAQTEAEKVSPPPAVKTPTASPAGLDVVIVGGVRIGEERIVANVGNDVYSTSGGGVQYNRTKKSDGQWDIRVRQETTTASPSAPSVPMMEAPAAKIDNLTFTDLGARHRRKGGSNLTFKYGGKQGDQTDTPRRLTQGMLNNEKDPKVNMTHASSIITGLNTYTGDVQEIKDLRTALQGATTSADLVNKLQVFLGGSCDCIPESTKAQLKLEKDNATGDSKMGYVTARALTYYMQYHLGMILCDGLLGPETAGVLSAAGITLSNTPATAIKKPKSQNKAAPQETEKEN